MGVCGMNGIEAAEEKKAGAGSLENIDELAEGDCHTSGGGKEKMSEALADEGGIGAGIDDEALFRAGAGVQPIPRKVASPRVMTCTVSVGR